MCKNPCVTAKTLFCEVTVTFDQQNLIKVQVETWNKFEKIFPQGVPQISRSRESDRQHKKIGA